MRYDRAVMNARGLLLALVSVAGAVACEQDLTDRPAGRYTGTFRPPPGGGGGGGDDDAGPGDDGGVTGRNVEGRVVAIDDLGRLPDRATGVPERQVGGFDTAGAVVTTISGADGAFLLESLSRSDPIVLSVSGEPPSYVLLRASAASSAIAPVVDFSFLEEVALTQAIELGDVAGHALLWLVDSRGTPAPGLTAEVVSVSPVQGPFFGTGDPVQIAADGPTDAEGLVVFLNAVPGDLELEVFRPEDSATVVPVTVPIEDGVVTFVLIEIDL